MLESARWIAKSVNTRPNARRTVLSNSDLEKITDTTDEWIIGRTGIKERRITHVENSDMAVVAGHHALAAAGLEATDIDSLIVATCSPDRILPSAASFVQAGLGAVNAGALDINAACSGFVYGITFANVFFIPVAGKLRLRLWEEIKVKAVVVEGVIGMMKGTVPLVLERKLQSFK